MKITDVEAIHLRLPEVDEIADGTQDVLVVKVHTDAGLVGIGEVTSQSYVCKAIFEAPRSAERRHGLAHILRGQDPLDVEGLWQRMYYHTNRYGRRGAAPSTRSAGPTSPCGTSAARPSTGRSTSCWAAPIAATCGPMPATCSAPIPARPPSCAAGGRSRPHGGQVRLGTVRQGRGRRPRARRGRPPGRRRRPRPDGRCRPVLGCGDGSRRASGLQPYGIAWLEEPLSQDDLTGYAELCPRVAGADRGRRGGGDPLGLRGPDPLRRARPPARRRLLRRPDRLPRGLPDGPGGRPAVASPTASARGSTSPPRCTGWPPAPTGDLVEYCLRPSPLMRQLVRNLPPLVDGRVPVPARAGPRNRARRGGRQPLSGHRLLILQDSREMGWRRLAQIDPGTSGRLLKSRNNNRWLTLFGEVGGSPRQKPGWKSPPDGLILDSQTCPHNAVRRIALRPKTVASESSNRKRFRRDSGRDHQARCGAQPASRSVSL